MPPDTTPMARWTVVLAVLTGLAVAGWIITAGPSAATSTGGAAQYTNSVAGPVGPRDRALLVAVRQAVLWEVPAVQQAQQMSTSPQVRGMGGEMLGQLAMLSEQVRTVSGRLNVVLPSQPSAEQQMWATDVSADRGALYDREVVGYLYRTCESTMATINQAQAHTENSDIRTLAQLAARVVGEHLRYLTATGLLRQPT